MRTVTNPIVRIGLLALYPVVQAGASFAFAFGCQWIFLQVLEDDPEASIGGMYGSVLFSSGIWGTMWIFWGLGYMRLFAYRLWLNHLPSAKTLWLGFLWPVVLYSGVLIDLLHVEPLDARALYAGSCLDATLGVFVIAVLLLIEWMAKRRAIG